MSDRSATVTNALIVAWTLIVVAAGWVALMGLGTVLEVGASVSLGALDSWMGKDAATKAFFAFFLVLVGAGTIWRRALLRREFRRQYAADRTIHVEQSAPPKPRGTYLVPIGVFAAALAVLGGLITWQVIVGPGLSPSPTHGPAVPHSREAPAR